MNRDNEGAAFDAAVFVAERWKALVLLPLFAAILSYVAVAVLPDTYSGNVRVPLVKVQGISDVANHAMARAAFRLDATVSQSIGPTAITLSTSGQDRQDVEQRLRSAYADVVAPAIDELENKRDGLAAQVQILEQSAESLSGLPDAGAAIAMADIRVAAAGFMADVNEIVDEITFIAEPISVDVTNTSMSPLLAAALIGTATLFAIYILLLMTTAVRAEFATPEGRKKMDRIRAAFGLRGRK